MNPRPLTTAALLAALALPVFAEDTADAAGPQTPPASNGPSCVILDGDAVVIPGKPQAPAADGQAPEPGNARADEVRAARVVVMDAEGNILHLDQGEAQPWIEGADFHAEMIDLDAQGIEFIEGNNGDIRVFLRQLGQPDVIGQAPVNPPMVEATYLGLNCEPLDFDTASLLDVEEGTGLNVTFVAPDSPAAAAGLEFGDTLLKLGDQVLINPEQLAVLIRTHDAGDEVTLHVVREGEAFDLTAELGTNTVPQLGPGGRNLNQFWNVERQGNAGQPGQFRVLPEGLHGHIARINPHGGDIEQQIEMIQRLMADQLQAMPDIEGLHRQAEQMRERMRLHQVELMRMFEELDIDPAEFGHEQQDFDMAFDGNAAMQIVWNDGEHTIQLSGDGAGNQTLNVKDAEGNELYDGPMPEGDALDELPEGVGDKVREMTEGQHFEFNIEVEEAPQVDEAPAAPQAPAEADAPSADL